MAKARKETINEERVVITPVDHVILELTPDEAETLLIVSANTVGSPTRSRRQYTDAIGAALRAAGVERADYTPVTESLWFKDNQ